MFNLRLFQRLIDNKTLWNSRDWVEFISAIYSDVTQDARLLVIKDKILAFIGDFDPDHRTKIEIIEILKGLYVTNGLSSFSLERSEHRYIVNNLNYIVADIINRSITSSTYFSDNTFIQITNWLGFNGYSNWTTFGDRLDSTFAAATPVFDIEFKIRNAPVNGGTRRLITKICIADGQRQMILQKTNGDLNFVWYTLINGTQLRGITWANALVDTLEHKIVLTYNGNISTNDGLDRVSLYIDDILVSAGKTLSTTTGALGQIVNSTAKLSIGSIVGASNTLDTTTSLFLEGEVKNFKVRNGSAVEILNGISVPVISGEPKGTYKTFAQPIIVPGKVNTSYDTCQSSLNCMTDIGTHWYAYILSSNPLVNSDRDVTTLAIKAKDNDLTTGWTKQLTGQDATVIYDVNPGKFDSLQVWLRNVRKKDDGTFEAWPVGTNGTTIAMGYSTSPDGIIWTRQNNGDAVYSDGTVDCTTAHIIFDAEDNVYKMLYCGNLYGERYCLATAPAATPMVWTLQTTGILSDEGLGWCVGFKKYSGVYYIWAVRKMLFFSEISEHIVLYTTTNLAAASSTFTYYGVQVARIGANEFGITSCGLGVHKKPNGQFWLAWTGYLNKIGKSANLGEEFTSIKAAELNRNDLPIAGRPQKVEYPSYVLRHWPLEKESCTGLNFKEVITGGTATMNSTPVFTEIPAYGNRDTGLVTISGAQTITDNTGPIVYNGNNLAVKIKTIINTSGNHELFRLDNSIVVSLIAGKLQIVLSADGTTETKKYISTVNMAKPTNMSYIDQGIWIGFTWIGGVLKLWNDFVEFTVTKTNDGALTNVFNPTTSPLIGQNTGTSMRSVSICSNITEQQYIDLEI